MTTEIATETHARDFVTRCLRALDERDYETLANGFAAHGVWARGGEQLVGPEAVRAALSKRPADLETQHLAANMVVERENADTAVVRYTIAVYAQTTDQPCHLHGLFRAVDRLAHTALGWRFVHRVVEPAFSFRQAATA